jgi:beta-glucosidase
MQHLTVPHSEDRGWLVEIFEENPVHHPGATPVYKTTTAKDLIDVPESLSGVLPKTFFVLARSVYTPEKSCRFRFGLAVAGKGMLFIDEKESIDLWTDHPPKTDETPVFNRVSTERFTDIDVTAGKPVQLQLLLNNSRLGRAIGTAATLTARLGGFQVLDDGQALSDAVELAKKVDIPIVMTGLSMDYEYEGSDRRTLKLPGRLDELIEATLMANRNTVSRDQPCTATG